MKVIYNFLVLSLVMSVGYGGEVHESVDTTITNNYYLVFGPFDGNATIDIFMWTSIDLTLYAAVVYAPPVDGEPIPLYLPCGSGVSTSGILNIHAECDYQNYNDLYIAISTTYSDIAPIKGDISVNLPMSGWITFLIIAGCVILFLGISFCVIVVIVSFQDIKSWWYESAHQRKLEHAKKRSMRYTREQEKAKQKQQKAETAQQEKQQKAEAVRQNKLEKAEAARQAKIKVAEERGDIPKKDDQIITVAAVPDVQEHSKSGSDSGSHSSLSDSSSYSSSSSNPRDTVIQIKDSNSYA